MQPAIENPGKLALPAAVEQALKAMFAGYRRVIIGKAFGNSLSGGRVIEAQPIRADGVPELPTVVKMAAISLIQKEWQAYRQHIQRRLPYVAEVIAEPVFLPEAGWGGLRYTLMGGGGAFEVMSLGDYCRRSDLSARDIRLIMERLFMIMQHLWKYHRPQNEFQLALSYDRLLPVNLLVRYPPSVVGGEPRPVRPDVLPADPFKVGELVRVSGFAVKKVDLVNQTVTLNLPQPAHSGLLHSGLPPDMPSYYLRLKSASVEAMAAHQVNQLMPPIEGEVIETRAGRLWAEARRALGQDFKPTDEVVRLSDQVSLPNPLLHLAKILSGVRGVNMASIHGDFNLENILVEPETGMVSLIDFAEAREDHVLHDFLRLETEVMTKLLPEILHHYRLPPVSSLASFYWQLHCAAFRPAPEPPTLPHPELEKPWAMLTAVRQAARHYLFEVNDPTEYYEGLLLYLLGALKFRNLDYLPEHPLPKQIAFWGAALAYQFLTTPSGHFNAPPPFLALLIEPSLQDLRQPPVAAISTATPPLPKTGPIPKGHTVRLEAAQQKLAALPLNIIPTPAPLPAGSRMLFSRNPLFVGRKSDLSLLAKGFKGGETMAISPLETAAVTGLGGIGKTQLATEFVHRYGQFFAGGVFWLSFANPEVVPAEIAACGGPGALDLRPDYGQQPLEEQVRQVLAAWQSPLPRLLVFDNCEEPELLARWRPAGGGCRVLVTSRRANWEAASGVQTLPLNVLPRLESLILLRKHHPDVDDATVDAIAAELGDLPLALHLAGSYLARYRHTDSPANYLAQLRDIVVYRPALLQHRSLQGGGVSPTGHFQNISRTIALSYNRLDPHQATDALALAMLARAACFAPGELIPSDLLELTLQSLQDLRLAKDDAEARRRAEKAVARLVELGLLRVEAGRRLRLHRLLAAFVQEAVGEGLAEAREAVEIAVFEEADRLKNTEYPALLLAWQPHLRAITEVAQARGDAWGAKWCNLLGMHLWQLGDYAGARPCWERALQIREKILGEEHPDTALSLNNLGHLLHLLGELTEGRPYLERAVAISQKTLGPEHPRAALYLNNLGYLLQDQGDLTGARPYHEQALAIREKVLGEDHPDTAQSLSNLGYLHYAQGDLARTQPYLERALAISQKVLGQEHPGTAFILHNLGELRHAQEDLARAQETFEQALAIRQKVLGEDHPDTALTLSNLGAVHQEQGDLAEARRCYEQALRIYEARLGSQHARTCHARDKLAALKKEQGAGEQG